MQVRERHVDAQRLGDDASGLAYAKYAEGSDLQGVWCILSGRVAGRIWQKKEARVIGCKGCNVQGP